ncbi:MAG: TldD/PmbA family protein, partial [Candidatus Atribacteria bacterium]|nr:TldD/PmbA family protein [Candidatus Atribacteria bacterium]
MKKIINQLKSKVDSAELFKLKSKTIPVNFEVGHLKSIDVSDYEGQALRVIKNNLIGFSAESGGKNPDLFMKKAIATSEFGMKANFEFPEEINQENKNSVQIYDSKISEKNISDMIAVGEKMIAQIKDFDKNLRCDLTILKHENEIEYLNSWGANFSYKKSFLSYSMMIQKTEEQDILMIYSSIDSGRDELSDRDLTDDLLEKLKWGKNIVNIESKNMPVILTPKAGLVLLLPIVSGLNGKSVLKKISPLSDKKGHKIWGDSLSLYSDGTIHFASGSAPFDDEGIKMRKLPLIKKGEIKNFYYDLQTAGMAGENSTVNGIRHGIQSAPTPGLSNLVLEEGSVAFSDMIKDVKA